MEVNNLADKKQGYITNYFSEIHDLDKLESQYKKYYEFFKFNYSKYLNHNKMSKIVDVGCGLGDTLYALRRLGYTNCEGIDYDEECVELCRGKGFACEKGDVKIYFKDCIEKYDAIIFNDIIEHFKKEDIVHIIRELYQALKPNGVLIIKTMNGANAILGTTTLYSDLTHEIMYDEFSLKALLKGSLENDNFRMIKIRPSNLYVYYYNPFNYIAWFVNTVINLMLRGYFILNNKKNKIFTKNILGIAKK